jgi:hypothetical protein
MTDSLREALERLIVDVESVVPGARPPREALASDRSPEPRAIEVLSRG